MSILQEMKSVELRSGTHHQINLEYGSNQYSSKSADSMQWKVSMRDGQLDKMQQIDEAAKQFESILFRQYLDEALKTSDENSLWVLPFPCMTTLSRIRWRRA